MSTAYIPTKDELRDVVSQQVRSTVMELLPEAIREATRKEWLNTDDVMEILQCSRRHVQHIRDENLLDYYQTNRTIRYKYSDVIAYLNNGKVAGGAE